MNTIEVVPTEFVSHDEKIRGNFVKPKGEGPFPSICKFHGLPGSADQVHGIAQTLAEAGFLVLTFDFRGFRASDGTFSLAGEVEDAKSAVTHLLESNWASKKWLGVYGASFGGVVAICLAVRDMRIKSICVRAPVYNTKQFTESDLPNIILQDIAGTVPDEMHGARDSAKLFEMFMELKKDAVLFNPICEIELLSPREVFIIAGDSDSLIDIEGVTKLYNQARKPKKMIIVKGADHNLSAYAPRIETEQAVVKWFKRQAKGSQTARSTKSSKDRE